MYLFSGGGYGGIQGGDGLTNGCSTIGISKMPPVEVMEQFYPILFEEFSLREGSGGAGEYRGGFGINYAIRLRRGEARGVDGDGPRPHRPAGRAGRRRGRRQHGAGHPQGSRPTCRRISPRTRTSRSASATSCACQTPGGGGFGDPTKRKPEAIARDVARGYYTEAEAREKFGARS